ncbi:unnamed protein product [Linum tenue]|uniref:Uncharacterized protein n=1 Tax=Linum tenue TaxID=586396 RepID=A0AAV0MZJ5_9ROSI|nr:unnamed protein product [Linum tenue]
MLLLLIDSGSYVHGTGKSRVTIFIERGNKCADYLASRGHSLPLGSHIVPISDPGLYHLLMYDCQDLSEPRCVMNES